MKIKAAIAFLLLCLITSAACKTRTEINGDVFVIKESGENYKLPLVNVIAIAEREAKPYVDSKKNDYDALDAEFLAAVRQDEFQKADLIKEKINQLTGAGFFNQMPPGAASAITSADGKFTLTLPEPGKYLIAASGGGFYWLIWINADGRKQNISLSNANDTSDFKFKTVFAN